MISKIADGVFFFLVFKACQFIGDHVFPDDTLEVLQNRLDYLEDELFRLWEASLIKATISLSSFHRVLELGLHIIGIMRTP